MNAHSPRRRLPWAVASFVAAALAAGCSQRLAPVPTKPIEAYPSRGESHGIVVAAECYCTEGRERALFTNPHPSLVRGGVYPLQLVVRNDSGAEVVVSKLSVRLQWPAYAVAPSGVAELRRGLRPGSLFGAIIVGPIGLFGRPAGHEDFLNELAFRELKDGPLPHRGTTSGFLYFVPPRGTDLGGSQIVVALGRAGGADEIVLALPIPPPSAN